MRRIMLAAALAAIPFATTLPASAQDAANGEDVFKKCRSCHRVGEGAKNLVDPQLNGLIGRKAGSVEGFRYSKANTEAGEKGLVWSEEELMTYLENPRKYMPGTKMAFAGLKDEQDRKDLIAYLKQFTN